jgi:GDP-L-fucose synthase
MNILITGANGYIGKSLYNALKEEHNVQTLTRKDLNLANTEQVKDYFTSKYFDVVIHCAIEGGSRLEIENPNILDDNLKMYYNLLLCKDSFHKLFHFGSGAERQNTLYGLSKKVINESIQNKDNFHNIRIFAIFDENELDHRFIKTNVRKYINKEDINVFINKYMDFFYMEDFITLIKYCVITDDLPKEINCTYSKTTTLCGVAEIINNLEEYKININIQNKEFGEPFNGSFIDFGLKYIGLEQGIRNVYNILKNEY